MRNSQSKRHCHFGQMHSNESSSDIQSSLRSDVLNGHGMLQSLIGRCGKRAARFRLRDNIDRGDVYKRQV